MRAHAAKHWTGTVATSLASALVAVAAACGSSSTPTDATVDPVSLIDHAEWTLVSEADDPFISDKPATAMCDPVGYSVEDFGVELAFVVETGPCNYITVIQPSLAEISVGDELHARVWHFELTAPDPGEAHVAIDIDGEVVWETNVDIPSGSGLDAPYWAATTAAPLGTPITFHMHNHGANSWALIELSVAPQ